MNRIDPITLSVINNYFVMSAIEMRDTLQRTAVSAVIYEDRDYACAILDSEGNTVAEAPGLTLFMGALGPAVKKSLEYLGRENIKPGDVLICTLPEYTGSHPNDMMLFYPIFFEDNLFGFTVSKAHLADLGAKDPYPVDSTDCFQEGLRVPPSKLYRENKLNEELADIIKSNSRLPELIWGDIQACIAALKGGELAAVKLLGKYGYRTVYDSVLESYDRAEKFARNEIDQMVEGTWSGEDFFDNNGVELDKTVNLKLTITVDKKNKELIFDYTGSDPQQNGPTNMLLITTISVSRIMGKILTTPYTSANEGSFRPIRVIAPENSVCNPGPNAPTMLYAWPGFSAMELFCKILAPVFPNKVPACSGGDLVGISRYGVDPDKDKVWLQGNVEGVGQGASAQRDGGNCVVIVLEACSRNLPVEIEETQTPILVEKYELIMDSGGAGENRGGLGVQRDYRYLKDGKASGAIERVKAVHWGVKGGKPGSKNYGVIKSKLHGEIEASKYPFKDIAAGDLVGVRTGGGGGYGNPLNRDPEKVLNDVIDGYVSFKKAKEEYGVAIEQKTMSINSVLTSELRNK